jgi:DNA-binding transcriptional regulator YdaS (Cro superfamily)
MDTQPLIDRLIAHFGGRQPAADGLDLTTESLRLWRKKGIPLSRALDIEKATDGAITAEEVIKEGREAQQ